MTFDFTRRLAAVSCLFLCVACGQPGTTGSSTGGVGGNGTGGAGGTAGSTDAAAAGLWVGESNGIRVCFFVEDDGTRLTSSFNCNLAGPLPLAENSYDIDVEGIGRDQNGQPCSFSLSYKLDVAIDVLTGAFGASFTEPGGTAELAFSGELTDLTASGVATRVDGDSSCTVGWAASLDARCDESAINACLDLQDCCRAILVNPVYFESCNSVVLQCNEQQCRRVLAGYPQCEQLDL